MPATREKLMDWLADLPDNTEIGIEDIYLVAMAGPRAQSFQVGDLSAESIDLDVSTFIARRDDMMKRMIEIHDAGAGIETDEGTMIVTYEGYISGVAEFFTNDEGYIHAGAEFFTNDANEAFCFKDRRQAEDFITEFADALLNPQVLDYP